jgi:hypothetical protein
MWMKAMEQLGVRLVNYATPVFLFKDNALPIPDGIIMI